LDIGSYLYFFLTIPRLKFLLENFVYTRIFNVVEVLNWNSQVEEQAKRNEERKKTLVVSKTGFKDLLMIVYVANYIL